MKWKGNIEQLPASPFYLETKDSEDTATSKWHKVAVSGNLFHKWQMLELPEPEMEQGKEAHLTGKEVEASSIIQPKSEIQEFASYIPDVELINVAATVVQVIDQLTFHPRIKNKQINWVDEWDNTTYSDIGIEKESREIVQKETLFEQILPVDTEELQANATEDMKESKFLSWLKDKEAKRQGYQTKKTEVKSTEEPEVEEDTELKPPAPDKKLSNKEKKKELRKILNKSLKMEDEIVSETLANVMVQQGHIGKAIQMYEKLSLIFPEKSSYFAEIIKKLEEV